MKPGTPFWQGFTAFCANAATLFVLDKTDSINIERLWVSMVACFFVAGTVYGKAKIDELKGEEK